MKGGSRNQKKRGPQRRVGGFSSVKDDPYFSSAEPAKKRKKDSFFDDDIDSDEEEENVDLSSEEEKEKEDEEEEEKETADEKRQRVAKAYLEKVRGITRREKEEEEGSEDEEEEEERDKGFEKEGERDSFIKSKLIKEQLEESGRLRREIASRVQKPESSSDFSVLVKHRQSVTAVCLCDDDSRGFSASKDGTIVHWDVDGGKAEKYQWPKDEILRSHGAKDPQGRATKHSKQVLALAVSSDGRYLASGGLDRHLHLWDTRTREHIQAFPGHRGPVSCLAFRQGTSELFSGSFDRSIKIWNVEDRAYINTLFGHQSEVLSIDCPRKERVLAAGRDRTMQLFKVPEESRLIYRASQSSLECCCFIDNDDFFSGSDDGSVELWTIQKKKPVYIVKNAHALLADEKKTEQNDGLISNGHLENHHPTLASSWVSSVTVCRGSDLAASGAGNGCVRLWAVENDVKRLRHLFDLSLVGFVNSLSFAKSGRFIVAGVGKEQRLGRWGQISSAQNGVAIQRLKI